MQAVPLAHVNGTSSDIQPHRSVLASAVILILVLCQFGVCVVAARSSLAGKVDFRAFYAAGTIVRSGHAPQLYDYEYQRHVQNAVVSYRSEPLPFLYPPYSALLFVPLSLVSYRLAFVTLLLLNAGLLVVAARLLSPWLPALGRHSWFFLPTLYCCLFATSIAFMQGQVSFVLLVVFCGSHVLLRRGLHFHGGLLLSLALIKFQLALPVLLLFVVWKHWRFVSGVFTGAFFVSCVSWAVVGRAGLANYLHSISSVAKHTAVDAVAAKVRYGMFPTDMPNLHGLTYALSHGAAWGNLLNAVLCCVVLLWAARQRASLLVALPAAMLVSYHMQPHDLTLLLLPLSFAGDDLLLRGRIMAENGQVGARFKVPLVCSGLLLVLPFAAIAMVKGVGYVLSVSIAGIMVAVATLPLGSGVREECRDSGLALVAPTPVSG